MREKILLMGPPGSGKTYQLVRVIKYLEELGTKVHAIDFEDKLEAMLIGTDYNNPTNLTRYVAFTWEEVKEVQEKIEKLAKPNEWIAVDRIDLSWPMVQRWFTQKKYEEELAEKMLKTSVDMKKPSRFIPRFDQGSWQVINEQYETFILSILYKSRCNILFTTGVKGADENSPVDIYGTLGILPRGQKEIGHQPHSVFLLTQQKVIRTITWHITTGKDLPNREHLEREQLFDFPLQYLDRYYQPEKK